MEYLVQTFKVIYKSSKSLWFSDPLLNNYVTFKWHHKKAKFPDFIGLFHKFQPFAVELWTIAFTFKFHYNIKTSAVRAMNGVLIELHS